MNYLVKRGITYIIIFFVVLNLVFLIPRIATGNPAAILASGSKFAPGEEKVLAARFGLNLPLYQQYAIFWKDAFSWPPYFGLSYQYYPTPVTTLIANKIGWSILLITTGFGLALLFSFLLAAITVFRRGGKSEGVFAISSVILWSTPLYWTSLVLLWVFGVYLNWFPRSGNVGFTVASGWPYVLSVISHAALPITAIALGFIGYGYLLLRASTQQVLGSDYVVAAEARGLRGKTLTFTYVLRNSMLPFVSVMSFTLGTLVSLLVLVESVFAYSGVGDLIFDAIANKDYPVLLGSFFYLTLIIIIGGFIGDIILTRLDPRLRR